MKLKGLCDSVDVSRLRVSKCDGLDRKALAQIDRDGMKRLVSHGGPETELIARTAAVKALEEIASRIGPEAAIGLWAEESRATERTGAAPLLAAPTDEFPVKKLEWDQVVALAQTTLIWAADQS